MSSSQSHVRPRRIVALAVAAAVAAGLTGVVAAPGAVAVDPGQTSTIQGKVATTTGAPDASTDVSYVRITCDATHTSISGSELSVTPAADGTWSFPAYPGQCYRIDLDGSLFRYQGKAMVAAIVSAGATGVNLTSQLDTKPLTLKVTGAANGSAAMLMAAVDYAGLTMWTPVASSTVVSGAASFTVAPGVLYTAATQANGDYYDQFLGGAVSAPPTSGGAGTFSVPATATSTTITATPKKSTPVRVNLTGIDAGATVDATPVASGGFGGPGLGEVGATTVDATGVTLHGLQPTPYVITVKGSHGVDSVSAERIGLTPAVGASTLTVNLTAAVRSDELSASTVYTTVTSDGGTLKVGDTLRAHTTLDGAAAPLSKSAGTKYTYYWVALDIATSGSARVVGTGPSLPITSSLRGVQVLGVVSIVTAPGYDMGVGTGIAFYSSEIMRFFGGFPFTIGDVLPGDAPVLSVAPAITGTAVVGGTLRAHAGTWNPKPTSFTYQWTANGKKIAGATKSTFVPGASQVGKAINVTVTPVLAGHTINAFTSAATAKVAKATSKSSVKAVKSTVKATKAKVATAKVNVTVAVKGVTPTGKVTVKVDKKVTNVVLKASKKGKITVTLTKLKPGKHTVVVRYLGSSTVKASAWSKKVVITVK
ncbi:MAG: Ig-like domain repeat protein [Brevundimonas sp.]